MTPSQRPRLQRYEITSDMLAAWRSGCIQWRDKNPNKSCRGCEFDGEGERKDFCEFDDDAMQKIFCSRPLPAAPEEQMQISDIIKDLEVSLDFYKKRAEMLQCWQSLMRDPERKIVCDILANGFTLTTKEEVNPRPLPPLTGIQTRYIV